MSNQDEFRFQSHRLLLELDASTTHMMMLVSAREVNGYWWSEAVKRHKLAYEAWEAFISSPKTDPMPALDARAEGSFGPLSE